MSDSRHGYPWQKKALPGMFSYESPAYVGDRPAIWARKCEKGWYAEFADRGHNRLSANGTNRDRAAKELLRLLAEKQGAAQSLISPLTDGRGGGENPESGVERTRVLKRP